MHDAMLVDLWLDKTVGALEPDAVVFHDRVDLNDSSDRLTARLFDRKSLRKTRAGRLDGDLILLPIEINVDRVGPAEQFVGISVQI